QPVAVVAVVPSSRVMAVNDSAGFRAEPRDATGNLLTNRPIAWFSSDSSVLRIDGAFGEHVIVRARKAGSAVMRATSEGKVGEAHVTVN
ncbi:MAG: hypothetical protein ACREMV_06820, partial [Gemmatimonadales bacterium]